MNANPRPFPIPVVAALGPGSHDDDALDYPVLPKGMDTYRPPVLPEPHELAAHGLARQVLLTVRRAVAAACQGQVPAPIQLNDLPAGELALVNQLLGEGEVSAQVLARPDTALDGAAAVRVRVQESVFAGVWRVITSGDDGVVHDQIEVGAVPSVLLRVAHEDGHAPRGPLPPVPAALPNLPPILTELADRRARWQPGKPAHVVNLTLLPLSPADIAHLDQQLGTGRVVILSRGYGNCRITDTRVPHTWRIVYYNSQDAVILNTVEVCAMPAVACAAAEDLADTAERLAEVLDWMAPGA